MKLLVPLFACALLTACPAAPPENPVTLRTYEVPGGQGAQLRGLLNQAFVWNKQAQAKATITPDGRLIVVGPSQIQDGVAGLIAELAKKPPEPPPTVHLEYWLLVGKPGAAKSPPPGLRELAPVIKTIEAEDGPQQLTLLEKLEARSLSDETARTDGHLAQVRQNASVIGGKVLADVNIVLNGREHISTNGPSGLDTRLELTPGKLLVLGQSGYADGSESAGQTLYYVVRATLPNAP